MKDAPSRYWDASVFIAWIKGEVGRVDVVESLVRRARQGDFLIVTSALTLAEVARSGERSPLLPEETEEQIDSFFANSFVRFVELSPALARRARRFQRLHGLKVRETYDGDFRKVDPAQEPGYPAMQPGNIRVEVQDDNGRWVEEVR